ncbi:MAG: hypothetical protein FH756_10210 [Firmicutes bacterium]|nr:hypothetical protein [Bacillota bacterium]
MARVKNPEHAALRCNYSIIPELMATQNYLLVFEEDSPAVLGKSIKHAMTGSYLGTASQITPTVVRHLAELGYYCRLGTAKGRKYLEVWEPHLILHKTVDWSVFEWGATIPVSWHAQVDKALGTHIERGQNVPVKLTVNDRYFDAKITNVDRQVKGNTYQLRYDSNQEFKALIKETFSAVYKDILAEREKQRQLGQKKPRVVVPGVHFIEVLSTTTPAVFGLVFSSGDFYDWESYSVATDENRSKAIIANKSFNLADAEIEQKRKERLLSYKDPRRERKVSYTSTNYSNPLLKEDIKQLYHYTCQICSTQIKCRGWEPGLSKREEMAFLTADAHHITALGDGGLDEPSNIICVCPNCHRSLHSGELAITFDHDGPHCINIITGNNLPLTLYDSHSLKYRKSL